MRSWKANLRDGDDRLGRHKDTYGEQYDKELHGRRGLKDIESLKVWFAEKDIESIIYIYI